MGSVLARETQMALEGRLQVGRTTAPKHRPAFIACALEPVTFYVLCTRELI